MVLRKFYENQLAPNVELLPSYEEILQQICKEPKLAVILSSYLITESEKSHAISCNITSITQASVPESLSMVISKRSPYKEQFNYK